MDDLVERLRAAIDADEQIALEALSHPSVYAPNVGDHVRTGTDDGVWSVGNFPGDSCRIEGVGITVYDEGGHSESQARHIALHDPKRELAMVQVHREILNLHEPCTSEVRAFVEEARRRDPVILYEPTGAVAYTACPTCGGRDWDIERYESWEPCNTLIVLAKGYGIEVDA